MKTIPAIVRALALGSIATAAALATPGSAAQNDADIHARLTSARSNSPTGQALRAGVRSRQGVLAGAEQRQRSRRQKSATPGNAQSSFQQLATHLASLRSGKPKARARPVRALAARNRDSRRFRASIDRKRGTVRNLRGDFEVQQTAGQPAADFAAASYAFLDEHKQLFGLTQPAQQLRLLRGWRDASGQQHARYQLLHQGLPVLHEEIVLHGAGGRIQYVNARYGSPQLASATAIARETAVAVVLDHLGVNVDQLQQPARAQLVVAERKGDYQRLWNITVLLNDMMRWEYNVDAGDGSIVDYRRAIHTELIQASGIDALGKLRQFTAWRESGQHYLLDPSIPRANSSYDPVNTLNDLGDQILTDADNKDNFDDLLLSASVSAATGWDPSGVSVHANTRQVYDYYLDTYGRDSMDSAGMNLVSVIHFGSDYANAFWNGRAMVFGDGDNVDFSDLGACLDITAHELSHGVIEFTANLVYRNQSGALNESFADIMAAMVDREDWLLGEDCVLSGPGYLRSLSNPNNGLGYQPKHMSQYVYLPDTEDGDYGGVHINSGIPNRAAYLIAEGLSVEGMGTSIGRAQTEQIFYRALTTYLNATSQFLDARNATLQAAEDLYGSTSAAAAAVVAAWDAVGVSTDTVIASSMSGTVIENVAGEDVITYLYPRDGVHDDDPLETFDVYVQSIPEPFPGYQPALDFGPLNSIVTAAHTRPAPVTLDNSLLVIYVGSDGNAYIADDAGNSERITDEGGLFSIAASHDGAQIALTLDDANDNRIYLLDTEDGSQSSFELASPNYSNDTNTVPTALYADSLAFDYTGRKLIYDFASCLPAPGENCGPSSTAQYWSIGVFDIPGQRFEFPFPSQATSLDLGFPRFATNSNRHFSFDLQDYSALESEGVVESLVYIYDSVEQELEVVAVTNLGDDPARPTWGTPSFSGDDEYLVFQATDGKNTFGFRTPLQDYAWNQADLAIWNDFDIGLPVAHRNADRDVSSSLLVSTDSLNFGTVAERQSRTAAVTLRNEGSRSINLTDIAVTGQYFTHNATNLSIAAGEEIAVTVNFSAGRFGGSVSDVMSITHDGDNALITLGLEAFVDGPELLLEFDDLNSNGRVDWNEGVAFADLTISANDMRLLRLYFGALGRAPDLGGFDFWRDRIANGSNFSRLGDEFFWSPEMQLQMDANSDGNVSNEEFVNHLYINVLQRTADAGGEAFWLQRLQAGDSVGLVMAAFLNEPEYVDKTLVDIADFALDNTPRF